MATTYQDTNVNQLVINKMTKQEYDNLSQVSDTELYLVEEQVDSVVTQNSTNPVQSGAVYEAIQDIGGTINDGATTFTKNNETIGTTSANQSVNQTIALPNDVVMCNLIDNKALASYATPITRFKYIEDHGWVDMDRSNIQYNEGTGEWTGTFVSLDITEGEYYYDMDNDTVFVADENLELQDVTSTVVIQGDSNKLYCDTTTNMLYRYDGTDFVALTSNFSGDYNDLINKPDLNFLKQVSDLDNYNAQNGEIVEFVGATNNKYTHGLTYKYIVGDVITIAQNPFGVPAGTYYATGETARGASCYSDYKYNGEYKYRGQTIFDHDGDKIAEGDWVQNLNDFTANQVTNVDGHNVTLDNGEVITASTGTGVYLQDHPIFRSANGDTIIWNQGFENADIVEPLSYKRGSCFIFLPLQLDTQYASKTEQTWWQHIKTTDTSAIENDIAALKNPMWTDEQGTYSDVPSSSDNIQSGWELSALFAKIKKWFASLKKVAFSGSYNDLTDKLQNATTSSAGLMSASDKTLINSLRITELTNITVTWLNNFSGTIRVFQYGEILQVYITTSSTQDVGINSRICCLNITPTYSTFYTAGILRSPTADPIGIFTSSQNSSLTFYIAKIYRTGNTYTGSMLIII